VKHAEATRVVLAISVDDGNVVLSIQDNGRGFTPGHDYPGHLGLVSMAERARSVGGSVAIESAPGAGCTVRVWAPAS
jgi:signal transduction histidine kinase